MFDVTGILSQIETRNSPVAEQLLTLAHDELAAAKLEPEKPGQTLQACWTRLCKSLSGWTRPPADAL